MRLVLELAMGLCSCTQCTRRASGSAEERWQERGGRGGRGDRPTQAPVKCRVEERGGCKKAEAGAMLQG